MGGDYLFLLFVWVVWKGHQEADSSYKGREEVSFTALHSVLSTVKQNLLLSLGCCLNPAQLIVSIIINYSTPLLPQRFFSRSLFLCHRPYCPPYFFNACFVHPSLPLPLSLSLHFSRTQLDMWMNTWNGPWGVESSVSMLMTPALLNTNTLHSTTMRVIWPLSTASAS